MSPFLSRRSRTETVPGLFGKDHFSSRMTLSAQLLRSPLLQM